MLNWTGDPYIDIGLATILAFRGKTEPGDLTQDDLSDVASWIQENYARDPLKSFLTVAFTSNAWFSQPSFTPEKRAARGKLHLFGWQSEPLPDERCVFTGLPATSIALSDRLPPGRAARAQVPLMQGDEDINFYPNGDAGLPISGEALLCLQAFPLGCAKVGGKLLAVHASDPQVTLGFADAFLKHNRAHLQVAQESGEKKMPETRYGIGTLLVDTLLEVLNKSKFFTDGLAPVSLTAYHLTNGQAPEIAIYHLPLGVTRFVLLANSAQRAAWQRIVQAAWPQEDSQSGRAKKASAASKRSKQARPATDVPVKAPTRRNFMYEDLLRLPDDAPHFVRRYLLRRAPYQARRIAAGPAPQASDTARLELDLVSWELTALFLMEVMNMDKTRIEHIRAVGDRLADYVAAENDRRFFRAFFSENRYPLLRNALIKASVAAVRRGQPPLLTFDQFIEVFEDGDEIARNDWRLARDLVLIRMIERLADWLNQNTDVIPEAEGEAETEPLEPTQPISDND